MPAFRSIDDLDVRGRRVLVRADLNVPVADGVVTDLTRLTRLAPTIRELSDRGARVIVLSHFGRPKGRDADLSLRVVFAALRQVLEGRALYFGEDCVGPIAERAASSLKDGAILVLENLRFHKGEEANDLAFAKDLARLGELYVNDAFSAAHRAHASTESLARLLPAAAGRLMQEELEHLGRALEAPARPLGAVVGGAKVSTKLDVLRHLVGKVDVLVIGGGMANTFLHAQGIDVGRSLCERDMAETVRAIEDAAKRANCRLILPDDAVVAEALKTGVPSRVVAIGDVPHDAMILDLGPRTAERICSELDRCRTIVWNGPLGAFETLPFDAATNRVARHVAARTVSGALLSVAGGGDTVAALAHADVVDRFSYVSTAGGAFLEWLEGKTLPGVAALAVGD
ncbi:MAG: phosphoglycerate kinase [Alphaproteobacteria bacterium]